MKKQLYTALLITLGFSIALSSCKKYETEPKDWFTEDLTFDTLDKNGIVTLYNLNNIYNNIPNGFTRINGEYLDAATDDAVPSRFNTTVDYLSKGAINAQVNPEEAIGTGFESSWANYYAGIRRANIFMKDVGRTPVTAANKTIWKSEARFLRAFFYFELLKRYGGVPILKDTILTLNDDIRLPRNTFAETVDYIVSECDAVKNDMRNPVTLATTDWGRVSKGAAVALKSRVLLYAASPLFNGGGIEADAAKKALTGYPTADNTRWQKVVAACDEFNDIKNGAANYYTLLSSGTPTAFISLFITKNPVEVIFAKQSANSTNLEFSQSPVGYLSSNQKSQGFTSPTQDFVDAFPMANGLDINQAGSGYNAATPYASRDPRLAATVFYNGLAWLGRNVETFEGGRDKPNNTAVSAAQTRTGYYLRKFLGNYATGTAYSAISHNFPIFRFGEIILNKAEALNELGQTEAAVTEIIKIRQRAGITAGTGSRYGIKAGITQTEMRTLIQNERRIELAFEEHRFWDVRRWKIAPVVYDKMLKGVRITNGTTLSYQSIDVSKLTWNNRMYHMPIPFSEISKNPSLVQNEGW